MFEKLVEILESYGVSVRHSAALCMLVKIL